MTTLLSDTSRFSKTLSASLPWARKRSPPCMYPPCATELPEISPLFTCRFELPIWKKRAEELLPTTLKLSIATLPVPPHATPDALSCPSQRNSPMFIEDDPLAFTVSPTNLSTLTTAELLAESNFEPSVLFMFSVPPDAETAEPAIYSIEEFTVRTPSPDLEKELFPPLAIESLPAVPSPIVTAAPPLTLTDTPPLSPM